MPKPVPHLHEVTGEVGADAPATFGMALELLDEARVQINMLERDIAGKRLRIAQLEKDRDAEARKDELWPQAVAIFRYWQERSGHHNTKFTTDRFHLLAPFIRREGDADCRRAIRGCLASDWHLKRGEHARRDGPVHDRLELIFGSQSKFEDFRDRDEPVETLRQVHMLDHAADVAARVLERAKLIDAGDPVVCAHLLLEIDRLNRGWLNAPLEPDLPIDAAGQIGLLREERDVG